MPIVIIIIIVIHILTSNLLILSCMQFPKFFCINYYIALLMKVTIPIHATLYHYNPCCTLYIIFYATIIHECAHTDEPAEESASARRRRERG